MELSKEDKIFLNELEDFLVKNKMPVELVCEDYAFTIEPCEQLEVWNKGEKVSEYNDFDSLIKNFKIHEKTFISQISKIEYN